MKNPSTRPATATIQSLLVFAMKVPMKLPIGLIPILTPKRNADSPTTIKKEPITNLNIRNQLNETNRKLSTRTSTVMGRTANSTSLSFSRSRFIDMLTLSSRCAFLLYVVSSLRFEALPWTPSSYTYLGFQSLQRSPILDCNH